MEGRLLDKVKERKTALKETNTLPVWSDESDVDLNLVFDVDDIASFAKSVWGRPGRGPYATYQIPHQKVRTFFNLKETFFRKWGRLLKRPINIVVPRTEEATRNRWSSEWSDLVFWWQCSQVDVESGTMELGSDDSWETWFTSLPSLQRKASKGAEAAPRRSRQAVTRSGHAGTVKVPRVELARATSHYKRSFPWRWCPTWSNDKNNEQELSDLEEHIMTYIVGPLSCAE